jgi:hypothetical protein
LLIFVVGTLLVAYAWSVVDTKTATVEAARQAARTYVESPDQAVAAAGADQAAAAALSGYGRDPSRAKVAPAGSPAVAASRSRSATRLHLSTCRSSAPSGGGRI